MPDESFTHDPVGNRLTAAGTSGSWSYNQNNELLSYNAASLDYDANGNTVRKVSGAESAS